MIALSSIEELNAAKNRIKQLHVSQPSVCDKLLHVVSLTKQMQFKYEYFGCLLMNEDSSRQVNGHIRTSILHLYQQEVNNLKNDTAVEEVKNIFYSYKEVGYKNLCKLILGESPESLKGIHKGTTRFYD